MKNLWALRYVFAMLTAFAAAVACFIWVVREFPVYFGVGVLLIITAAIVDRPNARRRQDHIKASVDSALHRAYASLPITPKLVMSYSYGYPAFEVSFGSKREAEAAATCNAAFKDEIAVLFKSPAWMKGWGPFFRPFSADQAVSFTYPGYIADLLTSYKKPNHPPEPTRACGPSGSS
jgi:hypothetical protein